MDEGNLGRTILDRILLVALLARFRGPCNCRGRQFFAAAHWAEPCKLHVCQDLQSEYACMIDLHSAGIGPKHYCGLQMI